MKLKEAKFLFEEVDGGVFIEFIQMSPVAYPAFL